MSKSNYLENAIQNHVFGGPDYVRPTHIHIALYTSPPTDAGGGSEVLGGSYVRVAMLNNSTNFPAAVNGTKSNGTAITFVTPTDTWGIVTHFGMFDASVSGNLLRWGALTIPKSIDVDDIVNFPIGELTSVED